MEHIYPALLTTREERGRQIAKAGKIKRCGKRWVVPSQNSSASAGYLVDLIASKCTCADYDLRKIKCKHQHAVEFLIAWEIDEDGTVTETVSVKRKTYPQNWAVYNAAQIAEKEYVEKLLKPLCDGIVEPSRKPGPGRPSIPLRDAVFGAVMKIYSGFSGRRAGTDIRECANKGYIDEAMHHNSISNFLKLPSTTALLKSLIEESAAPLATIEQGQFAQDSTGFSTVEYDRWFDQKHGKLRAEHPWVKMHVMIGTLTNVVTAVEISHEADCPLLPSLLDKTVKRFTVKEVSADKAYLSRKNLEAIDRVGARAYIPFKETSVMGKKPDLWARAWCVFMLKRDEFLKHYHRRSNVETTMWMIKSKFGASVRSKLPTSQVNEVLCKVLAHNLTCLTHAIFEFGLKPEFWKEPTPAGPPTLALVQ